MSHADALDPVAQYELECLSAAIHGAKDDLEKLQAVQDCAAAIEPYRTPELERDLIEIAQRCRTNLPPKQIEGFVLAGFTRARAAREYREERERKTHRP